MMNDGNTFCDNNKKRAKMDDTEGDDAAGSADDSLDAIVNEITQRVLNALPKPSVAYDMIRQSNDIGKW